MRLRQAPPALERHTGPKDPRRPASLMHACIVVSLMAGVRSEEARAIGWEQDVDLDGNPPSVAVLRTDRAGGARRPRGPAALKLAQMAVGALRECAAPDLLPESDTACCAFAVGAGPHSGNEREFQVQGAGYML